MANFKNITDLPVAESAEGLNLIVNDNGSAKQIAADKIGVGGSGGGEPDMVIRAGALLGDENPSSYSVDATEYENVCEKMKRGEFVNVVGVYDYMYGSEHVVGSEIARKVHVANIDSEGGPNLMVSFVAGTLAIQNGAVGSVYPVT